jgi:hypothetical protein
MENVDLVVYAIRQNVLGKGCRLVCGSVIGDHGSCNIVVGHAFGSVDLELHAAGDFEVETAEP